MEHIVQVLCAGLGEYYFADSRYDDIPDICEQCDEKMVIIPFNEITDTEVIFEIIEDEMENANMHRLLSMPKEMFDSAKEFVPEENHVDLARAIAKTIYDQI